MADLTALQQRYLDYQNYIHELFSSAKLTDGIFGLPNSPHKDKGHTQFFNDVGQLTQEMAQQSLSTQEAADAVRFLLTSTPLAEGNKTMEWMLVAAQQHALPLIPFLSPADAAALLADYEHENPKRYRLPAQKQVVSALKAQAKK
jgi:hypothetical protein